MCVCVCALCHSPGKGRALRHCLTQRCPLFRFTHLLFCPSITAFLTPVYPSLHHSIWLKDLLSILKVWSPCQLKTNPITSQLLCVFACEGAVCLHVCTCVWEWMCVCVCASMCVWDVRSGKLMQLGLFHSPLRSLCWPPDPKANNTESIIMTIGLCVHICECVWLWTLFDMIMLCGKSKCMDCCFPET